MTQKISASGLVMSRSGSILMVKRSDQDDFLPGIWELPGGGVDLLEDPKEGLKREIYEECALPVAVDHPLTTFSFVMPTEDGDKHTVEIIYLCKLLKENMQIQLSHEHSDYQWITFDSLDLVQTTDFMANLIKQLQNHPIVEKVTKLV